MSQTLTLKPSHRCDRCRKSSKKCELPDESAKTCCRCLMRGETCTWSESKTALSSCTGCRKLKHKCNQGRPKCSGCLKKGLECIYPKRKRPVRREIKPRAVAVGNFSLPTAKPRLLKPKINPLQPLKLSESTASDFACEGELTSNFIMLTRLDSFHSSLSPISLSSDGFHNVHLGCVNESSPATYGVPGNL